MREEQYFAGLLGDSSVSCGIHGGHSVVSWQMVDLEHTRWFIHMSGTLAGVPGKLASAGTVHQNTFVLPPSMAVTGSGLLTWQLRPPRGTRGLGLRSHTIPFRHIYTLFDWWRSHISPQVQGRECRYCLFMERGSNNSKPCF